MRVPLTITTIMYKQHEVDRFNIKYTDTIKKELI